MMDEIIIDKKFLHGDLRLMIDYSFGEFIGFAFMYEFDSIHNVQSVKRNTLTKRLNIRYPMA